MLEPADQVRAGRPRVRAVPCGRSSSRPTLDSAADLAAAALDSLGVRPGHPVRLDDSLVGAAVARAFGADDDSRHAGAGCLEPLLQVAGALAAGTPAVVVTAAPTGNVAVAAITSGAEIEDGTV
ncbi:hypothetical protein BBK82_30585 [Lentzea guizhouensis]|uniref:Uncharacterized protein n=1 Tax=Lentzea guizhouensis TaxID=1586287 RepID=A0A1B2HPU7_9PSEU|nr:hypothetical protein [Lentzea guizhouensis]ANZ39744.1 hypothetical protein BBK82_30585 [Lentzea guizhouensis]